MTSKKASPKRPTKQTNVSQETTKNGSVQTPDSPTKKYRQGLTESRFHTLGLAVDQGTERKLTKIAKQLGYPLKRTPRWGRLEIFSDVVTYLARNHQVDEEKRLFVCRNSLVLLRMHKIVCNLLDEPDANEDNRVKREPKQHSEEEAAAFMRDYGYPTPDEVEADQIDKPAAEWTADDIRWIRQWKNVKKLAKKLDKDFLTSKKTPAKPKS
jgi:hypothetical protein